jgi:hypothetical protein
MATSMQTFTYYSHQPGPREIGPRGKWTLRTEPITLWQEQMVARNENGEIVVWRRWRPGQQPNGKPKGSVVVGSVRRGVAW